MKDSVKTPKKITDDGIIIAVKQKFDVSIERQIDGLFGYANSSAENRHSLAKEITIFIDGLKKLNY